MSDSELVKQALAELGDIVRCHCDEACISRGLHDPSCNCDSSEALATVKKHIRKLTTELSELQGVFDFQWRAHMRAVEMWRTANPGNDLVLPDSAKLTVWMLEQLEAARDDAKEAEAYADELAGDQVDLCRQLIAAEDKLAKAVEAASPLLNMDVWTESAEDAEMVIVSVGTVRRIRATLAEIEGEKG